MIIGFRAAPLVDIGVQEFRRLDDRAHAVQDNHLVEGAVDRPFRRCAVVTDHTEDQRVFHDAHFFKRVEDASDLVIGVRHEGGIRFHAAL